VRVTDVILQSPLIYKYEYMESQAVLPVINE
jgi:hypothetical protein